MDAKKRDGYFTSSKNYKLIPMGSVPMTKEELIELKKNNPKSKKRNKAFGFSDLGKTLIKQKRNEILLGRSSDVNINTKPLKWGSLMEVILFQKDEIELEYKMAHKLTIVNNTLKRHSGTPDLISIQLNKVGEIKCFYPDNFCNLSLCLNKKNIKLLKKEFPQPYWQVVSNCILCGLDNAEIIAYMPYKSELEQIIIDIDETNILEANNLNPYDYYFMTREPIETLPFLPDDSKMKNINRFEFKVPQEDKDFLIERIELANKELTTLLNDN